MALKSQMSQLALLGLVLNADDEGRGVAEPSILARELAFTPAEIEAALLDLEARKLVQCYQVEEYHYYSLPRWREWQTLSRPATSKFPPSPAAQPAQDLPGKSWQSQENPDKSWQPQENPSEGKGREKEENRTEDEDEGRIIIISSCSLLEGVTEGDGTGGVVTGDSGVQGRSQMIPVTGGVNAENGFRSAQSVKSVADDQEARQLTQKVAAILRLDATPALARLVEDYQHDPLVSLLGEADNVREYIDTPQRNAHSYTLTPAFFRRWLQRAHEGARSLKRDLSASDADDATSERASGEVPVQPARAYNDLSNLRQRYEKAPPAPPVPAQGMSLWNDERGGNHA